jgi:rRNA biogenesis protein RRP5
VYQLAEQLFHSMTKRFSQSKKVWIEFGRFYMKNGKLESARKMLQRGLKSLPKRKRECYGKLKEWERKMGRKKEVQRK